LRKTFIFISFIPLLLIILVSLFWSPNFIWTSIPFGLLSLLAIYDLIQTKHAIRRNFPIVGHFRYLLESFRPEIMQYFVETNTQGRPFNRIHRSLVYQRSKKQNDTTPFGTQIDVNKIGYEWMEHSIFPSKPLELIKSKIVIGNSSCKHPYESSLLNISAMSYGSLSNNAIEALNIGAKIGGFAHNTGEGGISSYHLKNEGDLIWQIGTGYFGCRASDGTFDSHLFAKNAAIDSVKMVELKLSQGAKPGHGGILPGKKNTEEIAKIRGVEPFIDIHSPPYHSAFSDFDGLVLFIDKLRTLSNGKPIGFKLCIGSKTEFEEICKAMKKHEKYPDFITIDGGEGGTGAAPVEFSDRIGTPYLDGLCIAYNLLKAYDIKHHIKLICSGKIINGFHIAKALAMGADACNSARGMMLSLGCIQALECNQNSCPVGIATQNPSLIRGLDIKSKSQRVYNYHNQTIHSFLELLSATGLKEPKELNRSHIKKRISFSEVVSYADLYPY
jgi:glutamate synthase domain-containing protein 2